MKVTKTDIEELLRKNNISVTENRVKIVQCLDDGIHFHAITEIVDHMQGVNVKSVYNNIKTLVEAGIVDSYSFGGITKYALNDNLYSDNEIHLVNRNDVTHLQLNNKIFNDIKKEVTNNNFKVKNIKIFVEVEETKK